jgi:hypothetical protein
MSNQKNTKKSTEEVVVVTTPAVIPERIYSAPIMSIKEIMEADMTDTDMLVAILKIAVTNVDESKLPLDQCTDAELNKRLSTIYSKKVPAKKLKDTTTSAYIVGYKSVNEDKKASLFAQLGEDIDEDTKKYLQDQLAAIVDDEASNAVFAKAQIDAIEAYDDLLAQEELIKSYKSTTGTSRAGVQSSENVDPSTLDQLNLGKLIRNYQSKKSTAKKAADASVGDEKAKQLALVDYWQNKVDEATKYRTTSDAGKKVVETNNKVKDILATLQAGASTDPAVLAMIASLKALL